MTLLLYVLRQFCLSLAFAVGGISFVILPALTVAAVHKLQGVGVEALVRFLPLLAIEQVPYLLPMGFLLAVVATFGRLAADNEWTAIHMAGVHPLRTLLPVAAVGAVLAVGTGWLMTSVRPEWKHRQRSFQKDAVRRALSTLYPGRTRIQVGDFYLDAAGRDGNLFRDVLVYVPRDAGRESTRLVADQALLGFDGEVLSMEFGHARWARTGQDVQIERPVVELPLDTLVPPTKTPRTRAKYLTSAQIRARLAGEGLEEGEVLSPEDRRSYLYEFHRRLAFSATYFLFLVLGVPTGLWLRRGTQLGALAVAVGYGVVYYFFSMRVGQLLAEHGAVPTPVAAWLTTGVGMAIGLVFLWRVGRR